ncbi:MAG: acylphosphatase [Candidatus Kapaibacteriota bacterium]
MEKRVKFIVKGFVQGVGYRFFTYTNAIKLNLKGYVKNLYDGDVEVVVEGPEENIEQLRLLLLQGPSRSIVKNVITEELKYTGSFDEFFIY